MKNGKKLLLLLLVLAVLVGATAIAGAIGKNAAGQEDETRTVFSLNPENVTNLGWDYSEKVSFTAGEDGWVCDQDAAFPLDETYLDKMLEALTDVESTKTIENPENLDQYGLEIPVCVITVEDGQSHTLSIGLETAVGGQRYFSNGDGNVYLVQNDPLDYFDAGLSDMIDHDETPDFDKVTGIRFAGTESYSITYEEDSGNTYCEEDVYFAERAGSLLPLDTSRVDAYLQKISGLSLTDYVTYNATAEELEACGLDTPELTVTVDYTYEDEARNEITQTFVLQISRDPEEQKAAEEASDQEEGTAEEEITAYARVGDSRIVYRITANEYKALMDASYDALRHIEVLSADFSDVTQLDISLEGAAYSITAEGSGDGRTYSYLGEELEIGDLQSALESLKAESFTDERPTQKKEIGLTVHLDNENYPEVRIELYRYDGTNCLAVVDGTPVSLVARADVVDLIEAVNEIVLN